MSNRREFLTHVIAGGGTSLVGAEHVSAQGERYQPAVAGKSLRLDG